MTSNASTTMSYVSYISVFNNLKHLGPIHSHMFISLAAEDHMTLLCSIKILCYVECVAKLRHAESLKQYQHYTHTPLASQMVITVITSK